MDLRHFGVNFIAADALHAVLGFLNIPYDGTVPVLVLCTSDVILRLWDFNVVDHFTELSFNERINETKGERISLTVACRESKLRDLLLRPVIYCLRGWDQSTPEVGGAPPSAGPQ